MLATLYYGYFEAKDQSNFINFPEIKVKSPKSYFED